MQPSQIGKYRILAKIGQGAMGEVFRAEDPVLERQVAIKVLSGRWAGTADATERFLREAKAAAGLNHPNIITVHDFGEANGTAFMAMELLDGSDLRDLLEQKRLASLAHRLDILDQIIEGVAYAHAKGVVHRDLKPGNVHVLSTGRVKIVDFGLARRAQDGAATGVIMGTPYYMSPEQAQGEGASARSDVFSLGALAYELLGGKRAFAAASIPAVLYAVVHSQPEPLVSLAPDLPPALPAVVMRALEKSPPARYADAGEMLVALRDACTGAAAPEGPAYALADPSPARPLGPAPSTQSPTAELQSALEEIELFLADRVPPLMVADSVSVFSRLEHDEAAAELWAWAERQQEMQPDFAGVDLLFHALRKLSVIGEFQLLEGEGLLEFLKATGERLAQACAPEERVHLRRALLHLGESELVKTGSVEEVKRQAEPAPAARAATTPGLRRLSLLEQRLHRERASLAPASEAIRRRIASQAIATAAHEAASEKELQEHLRRLRAVGVASEGKQVFRSLGQQLADWAMPREMVPDTKDLGAPGEVQAMKKIVSLPEDPLEVARRFRHLVTSATEQFNEGNLGRSVQMFELAARLATEKKVEPGLMEPILRKGHEALSPEPLRQYLEKPDRHPQLQQVLLFFERGLGPAALLDQLESEERRERRRLLLDLLAVHGERARAIARSRLLERPGPDFARRNWIYLLRSLAKHAAPPLEPEIDAVARLAAPGRPGFLAKEALLHLGQLRHPRAVQALVKLLADWEAEAEGQRAEPEETLATLDRIAAALARQGGARAWNALVDHALSRGSALGDTLARLGELGSQDLASAPDVVEALLQCAQREMPRGVLGRLVGRKGQDLPAFVAALEGTRTPDVRAFMEEVARRAAGQEAARVAERALEAQGAAPAAAAGSGDLEAYGLPALLHRHAESRATGTLTLLPREGAGVPASVGFAAGRIVSARWAHREGEAALHQLFERPVAGQWTFSTAAPPAGAAPLGELGTLVREGVMRARELARTAALVPDDVPLEATGTAPGTVAEEPDYDLVVSLWNRACAGETAARLESELAADAFRIQRPLAQWLEEGALRISAPEEPDATSTAAEAKAG
jgi:serine/threonine-protein kinase